jgi:hypothetical protein
MRQARLTITVDSCDLCPQLIKGRMKDTCNIADRVIPDSYFKRDVPEWCPCLINDIPIVIIYNEGWYELLEYEEDIRRENIIFKDKDPLKVHKEALRLYPDSVINIHSRKLKRLLKENQQ